MRLTPEEVAGITTAVAEVFGPEAVVRLFGSRVRDDLKGGDIDLLVEAPPGRDRFEDECALSMALEDRLGERKIDVLLLAPESPRDWIAREALEGVVLRRPEGVSPPPARRMGTWKELRVADAAAGLHEMTEAARALRASLAASMDRVARALPVSGTRVSRLDPPTEDAVLGFLKRFEQLQDLLGSRLARAALAQTGDNPVRMPARDVFDALEKFGAIEDSARFFAMLGLRNRLTHEYPMSDEKRASRINEAWTFAPALLDECDRLTAYADRLLAHHLPTLGDAP